MTTHDGNEFSIEEATLLVADSILANKIGAPIQDYLGMELSHLIARVDVAEGITQVPQHLPKKVELEHKGYPLENPLPATTSTGEAVTWCRQQLLTPGDLSTLPDRMRRLSYALEQNPRFVNPDLTP